MQELLIKIVFMALFVAALIGRAPYAKKYRSLKVINSIHRLREIRLLFLSSIMMILPLIYVFTHWIDSFNMNLTLWARILGLSGFAFAVFLHNWTHKVLGLNWSPILEIKKKQKLITSGPYKRIRHPMYAAFLLWSFFQGFALSNWLVLIGGMSTFLTVYFTRVYDEEKMMLKRFGKEYRAYMGKTWRFFPRFLR